MELIESLGIKEVKLSIGIDKRQKDKKLFYRLVAENSREKMTEMYILNIYFINFFKENPEKIKKAYLEVQEKYGFSDESKSAFSFIAETIKSLFFDYIIEKNLESDILKDIKKSLNVPTDFIVKQAKSPFAIQREKENTENDYIAVLYMLKESNLDSRKNALNLQVHNAILKAGTTSISNTINVVKLNSNLMDILGFSEVEKDIIKKKNGILRIQTTTSNPTLRGAYEIINI